MNADTRPDEASPWLARQQALATACMRHRVAFRWDDPGTFLIDIRGAAAVLRDVMDQGFEPLGIEGFEIADGSIHPRLDLIYDAGRSPGTAFEALARFGDGVWVDFAIASRDIDRH